MRQGNDGILGQGRNESRGQWQRQEQWEQHEGRCGDAAAAAAREFSAANPTPPEALQRGGGTAGRGRRRDPGSAFGGPDAGVGAVVDRAPDAAAAQLGSEHGAGGVAGAAGKASEASLERRAGARRRRPGNAQVRVCL